MPVITTNSCTAEAVLEALRSHGGSASYETDNSEELAHVLGFDRTQVNTMFHHLKHLSSTGRVYRTREDAVPRRLHDRGPCPAIVRRVTFTVAEDQVVRKRREHTSYFVR